MTCAIFLPCFHAVYEGFHLPLSSTKVACIDQNKASFPIRVQLLENNPSDIPETVNPRRRGLGTYAQKGRLISFGRMTDSTRTMVISPTRVDMFFSRLSNVALEIAFPAIWNDRCPLGC